MESRWQRKRLTAFLRVVSFLEFLAIAVSAGWSYTKGNSALVALTFCLLGARSCSKTGLIEELVLFIFKSRKSETQEVN